MGHRKKIAVFCQYEQRVSNAHLVIYAEAEEARNNLAPLGYTYQSNGAAGRYRRNGGST